MPLLPRPPELDSVPKPETPQLIRFLDFVYVVVFGHFIKSFFDQVIMLDPVSPIPIIGLDTGQLQALAYCAIIFWFVTTDWISARLLADRNSYPNYIRFMLDLAIAFLSYFALQFAVTRQVVAMLFLVIVLAAGALWSLIAHAEKPDGDSIWKLRLIIASQTIGAAVLFIVFRPFASNTVIAGDDLAIFALIMVGFWIVEEIGHAWLVPPDQWFGPRPASGYSSSCAVPWSG